MATMRVALACAACGDRAEAVLPARTAICRACRSGTALESPASQPVPSHLGFCVRCGESRLYRQKDLDRRKGLATVAAGAAISLALLPFSPLAAYGVLGGLAVVDLWLYRRLPEVAICYRCRSEHRGYATRGEIDPFDLLTLEMVDQQNRREGRAPVPPPR
jgi:hypothetical protein